MLNLVKRFILVLKREIFQSARLMLLGQIMSQKSMPGLTQELHIETKDTCNLSFEYCVLRSSKILKKIWKVPLKKM